MSYEKPVDLTLVKILQKGKERLEKGWCQGRVKIGNSYCLMGATWEGVDIGMGYWKIDTYLSQATGSAGVTMWNDTKGRTQKEVVAAMDKAIELAIADAYQAAKI